jgi:hypothetical protein
MSLLFLFTAAPVWATELSRQPYPQMTTHESAVLVWRTGGPTEPVVRIGSKPDALDRVIDGDSITQLGPDRLILQDDLAVSHPDKADPPDTPLDTHQFEAHVRGLEPDTRYYYAVYDGQRLLAGAGDTHYFSTHPRPGEARPLRIWVAGDSGAGGPRQAEVFTTMRAYVEKTNKPVDMFIHVGDMAYTDGTDEQFQNNFFDPYEALLRNTVIWPTMGNHEGMTSDGETATGPYYDAYVVPTNAEIGGLASGTEAYYAYDYGNVHFICLNSHDLDRSPSGAMARWLKSDLALVDKAKWLIAFWHHAPYTKGSHDSDSETQLIEMHEYIMPILDDAGVDLVLTGHSHIYERSMLIDGAYATPTVAEGVILDDGDGDPEGDGPYRKSGHIHPHEGHVQIVTGHSGTSNSRKGTMPIMRYVTTDHGSMIIDIDGDTLNSIMVDRFGSARDRFQIVKRGKVNPKPVANPWQPEPWLGDIPLDNAVKIIQPHDTWQYLLGDVSPGWMSDPAPPGPWKQGKAGFGYGDNDDNTVLDDMKNKTTVVNIRHTFKLDRNQRVDQLGLMVRHDDGFVAYLNGQEVLRVGVKENENGGPPEVELHEAREYKYFEIPNASALVRPGDNILAIEAHNESLKSSDLTIDPYLVATYRGR